MLQTERGSDRAHGAKPAATIRPARWWRDARRWAALPRGRRLRRPFALLVLATLAGASPVTPPPHWSQQQISQLLTWMSAADGEGLSAIALDLPPLRAALATGKAEVVDAAATQAATQLLLAHRDGCCNAALREGWHIAPDPAWSDAHAAVALAVSTGQIDALFSAARPAHPFYQGLRQAYAREQDPDRRATLAANLDRWRWMPRDMGHRYLLVNAAGFEATLWQDNKLIGRWAVVVGKAKSPTPVFRAMVTGVTFNPWWDIPATIARESVAGMIAHHPRQAAAKGYVLVHGRYRQKPGPDNALGRMKLVMPNAFSVYLHDTPAQALFQQNARAYSHGCIRVGDALGLATTLLSFQREWDHDRIDALVATGRTQTVALAAPIPVYIAYFTAEPDGDGGARYFPDIYHRDSGASPQTGNGACR
ncbi:MAG: L,D-transpeptidase family protein [Sphingomonadales bacterium]|nr:L,D-transpeptidase family protein [Sphingomonadales bacterium]MDE2170927.1 L,D-transpeptidase family protein [Sphingomonadales bacterium]